MYAHLDIPLTQHGLVTVGGQLCINQDPALPQCWTAMQLPNSQHQRPEDSVLNEGQQLKTTDLDMADMV